VGGLEQLWAGWRHEYVAAAGAAERSGSEDRCVFCSLADSGAPSADNGVVHRSEHCYAVLNAYPYASGHLLVVPSRHVEELQELSAEESAQLWSLTQEAVAALGVAYQPEGMNLGANLGRAAGAGIPRHLHLHVVPRWAGDTNFMTAVAGVRVLPESLSSAWEKLHAAWPTSAG
jgi:diadenosine tetraphosphate (Ap4A) HIT family hydrolase